MSRSDVVERILTDIKARPTHDVAELYLKNTGTLLVPLREHVFTSRHFSTHKALEDVLADVQTIPGISITYRKKNKHENHSFNVIQLAGPPSIAPLLRERQGTNFDTKNYTRTAREHYGNPGTVLALRTGLKTSIAMAKLYNERRRALKEKLRAHAKGKNKAYVTRMSNELDKAAMDKQPTSKLAEQNAYLKHLPEHLIKERDELQELYTTLEQARGMTPVMREGELELLLQDTSLLWPARTPSHTELIDHTWAHLDIEIPGWKTDKPETSWVVIHYEREGEVYKQEMHTASGTGQPTFADHDVIDYQGDIAKLLLGVKESIRREDPLLMTAHNGKFDYINLRDAEELKSLEESFTPDEEDQHQPVHEATTRFFERIGVKSRLLIDFLRFAQIQYDWLPNKKLSLVAKVMLGEKAFDKELTYDEMELLEEKARQYHRIKDNEHIQEVLLMQGKTLNDIQRESEEAARKIASYAGKDVAILAKMRASPTFTNFLDRVTNFADRLNLPIEHLAYSSRAVQKTNERAFLKTTGAEYDKLFRSSQQMRAEYAENKQGFRKTLERLGNTRAEPGLYVQVHLLMLRYGHALKDLLVKTNPEAAVIFNERPRSKEDRVLLSRYGNALAEWLIADYERVDKLRRGLERKRQKVSKESPRYQETIRYYQRLLKNHNKTTSNDLFHGSISEEALKRAVAAAPFALRAHEEIDAEDLRYLLNNESKLAKAKYKFEQQFQTTYEEAKTRLERMVRSAKRVAEEHGLRMIHQEGPYFYLQGDPSSFLEKYEGAHPIIHTFEEALITHDTKLSEAGNHLIGDQQLYTTIHGHYKGIKIVDHPAHHLNMNEMRQFQGFYQGIIAGRFEQALEAIIDGYNNVAERRLPPEELLLYSKASDRYTLLQDGEELHFRTKLPPGISYHPFSGFSKHRPDAQDMHVDEQTGRPYALERSNNKQTRVYLLQVNEARPDWDLYLEKQRARIRNHLSSLITPELTERLLEGVVDHQSWRCAAAGALAERVHYR
ncbi:hypothetical protein JXA12_02750 [Candidatus Woesearchaeota archaeon]|nr:hypothetical protein [Candidatus Woesearchaeota archaeon]